MNKLLLVLGIALCAMLKTTAQISQGGEPQFWKESLSKSVQIPVEKLDDINLVKLLKEDNDDEKKGVPFRFAYPHKVNFNPNNSGKWFTKSNGDSYWIFIVESKGAKSLNFTFSDFYLPKGATLFLYNADRTDIRGAFTASNNKSPRKLGTAPIAGDKVIIEYFQPATVKEKPALQIATVAHDYRGIFDIAKGYGDSGSCNNNVACSVGNNWRDQIRSVGLITLSNGSRFCSGALINNTRSDGTPYFLTANHCTGSTTSNWVFVFNYQSNGCSNSDGSFRQSVSGSQLLKKGAATDYSLLRLSSVPPASYKVYYAGWDASGQRPSSTTGIHHPRGDIKKISFDYNSPSISAYGSSSGSTHWRVNDWDDGTTEGGSSGSPLFDQNKRIVGQLHGGRASCGNNGYDVYGRFDLSFPNLSQWLAPGSSLRTINGYDPAGGGGGTLASPENLVAQNIGSTSFGITWSRVSDASSYDVQLWNGSDWVDKGSTSNTSFSFSGLVANDTEYVRVRATNSNDVSDWTSYITVQLNDTDVAIPAQPTNLKSYNVNSTYFGIYWTTVDEATSYDVQRWTGSEWEFHGNTSSYYYYLKDLPSGSTQYVRVRSKNSIGTSDYTEYITVNLGNAKTSASNGDKGSPDLKEVVVFPNPVISELHIQGQSDQNTGVVSVFTIFGKLILEEKFDTAKLMLDVSLLQSGAFFVVVKYDDGYSVVKKIVKE